MRRFPIAFLPIALLLGVGTCLGADDVLPIHSVVCTGSWKFDTTGIGQYGCARAFDGLTTDSTSGGAGPGATFWLGREQTENETLTFDLGSIFSISSVDLYNTHNGINNDRGTVNFKIWISTPLPPTPDNNPSSSFGTLVLSNTLVFFPSTDPNPRQSFSFSPTLGRYVTFRAENFVFNTFHGDGGTGLSEIVLHGQGVCVAPPSGMVGWWPGEGNANDIIGSNNGTLENGSTFATGKVGQAFSFNGTNQSVSVADSSSLRLGAGEITLDAWVSAPSGSTFRTIVAKVNPVSPFQNYYLRIDDDNTAEFGAFDCGTLFCGFRAPGRLPVKSTSIVADNTFHHVAGVRRSTGSMEIYVDGVLQNTIVNLVTNTDSSAPLGIGGVIGIQFLQGLIDEVEIYNRALSASEIQSIFSAGSAGKCKNQPPVANAGPDQTVECNSHSGTSVMLDGSASSDPDGDTLSFVWRDSLNNVLGTTPMLNVTTPLGTSAYTLTVTDPGGLSSNATTHVTVRDTTPPVLSVSLSPATLWPPNHKLVPITASIVANDTCDPNPIITLVSITSNEPLQADDIQAVGGGPVAVGTDVRSFQLRAERLGSGNGRIYTVTYRATDHSGNSTVASGQVSVPHDQGKH